MNIAILIPTLNAGLFWSDFLTRLENQTQKISYKIILDSGSTDNTVDQAKEYGFEVLTINKKDFDHGYARRLLANAALDCDILIYLTQDCLLADIHSIKNLVAAFKYDDIAVSYGRQLPHKGAKILETHARLFNYPDISIVKSLSDKNELGIKTASCSNSFAAYRRTALEEVGGFPKRSIFGEDVIVGGKMLQRGWKIAYVADATVFHSHDYTVIEEFKRYFDIGVFHSDNYWLIEEFGKASGEGIKYVKSEFFYVLKHNPLLLFKMAGSIFAKYCGYKLGMMHRKLSLNQKRAFSMHKKYWI